jgi:superoxide dismutase, Cu-Zn family
MGKLMPHARVVRYLAALAMTGSAVVFMPQASAATRTMSGTTGPTGAHAVVRDVNNTIVGTVSITAVGYRKLVVTAAVFGLTKGFHGFHIHTTGICDPSFVDATGARVPFGSAGGHLDPTGAHHGAHAGDLPPLLVTTDSRATSIVVTDAVTLANIFDADGAAVVVHALPDNFANIAPRYTSSTTSAPGPDAATLATGDSGARTACGVLRANR